MRSVSNYQPSFFDYIENTDNTAARFYECWASWYSGGRVYKVVYVEGEGYKKVFDDEPASYVHEIAANVMRVVFFPFTLLAIVLKLIYRPEPPSTISTSINTGFINSSPINSSPINSSPINSSPINSSPINSSSSGSAESQENGNLSIRELLMHLFSQGLLPGIAPVQCAENLIKHIEETHLELPDPTALNLLKELMEQTPRDRDLIAEILPVVQRQVEETRKAQQEASKKKELSKLFEQEFNDCECAQQTADKYQVDCSSFTTNDLEFVGALTCFYMVINGHHGFKNINKKISETFQKVSEYSKESQLKEEQLLPALVFELAKESNHEVNTLQETINGIKQEMSESQKNNFDLLKTHLKALQNSIAYNDSKVGEWQVSYREVWGTILRKGMGFPS